ncbi:beta strand repeat-containing protein [Ramlibacter albus]|uniref:Calcium-binding protein n=1 Tax=Ramlibacter albus TaxID=2079448 RepID=A0A923M8D9_9BURK|nr:hypothetical protein [Ramlibacter albus]MBC5764741.1 hypothetical protein [Ramlibacter albus]
MPAQIFGAPAAAVQLYIAFYGQAPSNPIYNNLIGVAGASSTLNLALTIGNQFATVSDSLLATSVLTNLGITATTIPAASYTALQTALTQAFAAYPTQRGIVVLNAMNILTTLETDATFGTVAQTFNQSVTNAYVYASNPNNVQTQTLGSITTTSPLTVNAGDIVTGTSGNDNINGNLFFNTPSGTFFQTINTGDTVNGGAGTDTLNAGFNNGAAQTISATLTSIENLAVNATAAGATTLDMTNGTGLTSVSVANGAAGGDITLTNLGTVLSSISLNATQSGLIVTNTAASIAGTADTVAVNLSQAATLVPGFIPLSLAGYEIVNVTTTGPSTNRINVDGYSAGATFNVSGTRSLSLSSGVSTNQLTVDATGMTGTGTLTVNASGAANNVRMTGSANGDTLTLGANYTTADTYNGAAGNDTISMNAVSAVNVTSNQTNLSNLEILSLATDVNATGAAATNVYLPVAFGGATQLTLAATGTAGYTVNYGAGTAGLNLRAGQAGTATVNSSGSATNDVLNLNLGVADTTGSLAYNTIASTGFETINVASNGALGATNTLGTITLTATAAPEVVNFTGANNVTVGAVTADQINASALTGSLNMTAASFSAGLAAGVAVTNNGVQITGGAAADTLFGSDGADQIVGGAGADRILFGTNVSQGDIVTGGDGADQFRFTSKVQSSGTAQIVKITDFVAGTDKIGLVGAAAADFTGTALTGVTMAATTTITTADTLTQVYASAGAAAGGAAATPAAKLVVVSAGLAAGTYLAIDMNNDGTITAAGGDMLINITGVTGTVTASDFVFV